jgi:hypothetical protein
VLMMRIDHPDTQIMSKSLMILVATRSEPQRLSAVAGACTAMHALCHASLCTALHLQR